jgi:hypothetical protein
MLWRIFEVKYLQYIAFKIVPAKGMLRVNSLLQFPCDMMRVVAQTKPTSEELERSQRFAFNGCRLMGQALAQWKSVPN